MHVLIISQIFPPDMAGSATRAYNVAKGLAEHGVKVTVVAGFPHYPLGNVPRKYRKRALVTERLGKARVIRTFMPPLASQGFARRLVLFMFFLASSVFPVFLVGKVDCVFASNPQMLSFFPALVYKALNQCPVILNVDDLWPEELYDLGMVRSRILMKIAEFVAKVAYTVVDVVMPISSSYAEVIVSKYGAKQDKVIVIPGGVDLNLFPKSLATMHRTSQIDEFTVMYIGAFSPAYNFDQVLDTAKLLDGKERIRIVFQGGGEMTAIIRKKAVELKLKNFRLIDKIVSRAEVADIMMRADALLLPLSGLSESVEKGISAKLYEYHAAGKPVVCCSSGASARHVEKTQSGIVVRPGDHRALAEAILRLYRNPETCRQLGTNGRLFVESNSSLYTIGSRIVAVIKEASGRRAL